MFEEFNRKQQQKFKTYQQQLQQRLASADRRCGRCQAPLTIVEQQQQLWLRCANHCPDTLLDLA